jgi:uncharacterized protein
VPSALVLSGGISHDFAATTERVVRLLDGLGVDTTVTTSPDDAFVDLARGVDLFVVNAHWWRMTGERWAHLRDQWAYATPHEAGAALWRHLAAHRGVVALHVAVRCFDDWPGWGEALGASWHPSPLGQPDTTAAVVPRPPVVVHTLEGTTFEVVDEVPSELAWRADVQVLARDAAGTALVWRHEPGGGRVAVDLLGHDVGSYADGPRLAMLAGNLAWAGAFA